MLGRKILSIETRRTIIAILGIFLLCAQQVAASTANDFICAQQGDFGGTCFYDPNASSSCSGTTTSFGPGTLPSYVKEPYNSIFTAAGNKFNVDPGVLVGIFYNEQYGYNSAVSEFNSHTWPPPPPPYGSGPAWSSNTDDNGSGTWPDGTVGARGPFQFEPGTWQGQDGGKGYEYDGNGDGKKDPTDLADAAFGAANYLAALGATIPESQSKIEDAATHYSGGYATYSQATFTIFQTIKSDEVGGGGGTPAPSGGAAAGTTGTCPTAGSASVNCATTTGNALILCEARQYAGIYYGVGASHDYKSFEAQCPASVLATAASNSTTADPGPCQTDCSGLVSVAVDQAFGQNFSWDVGHIESDHADWQKLSSTTNVQPGDVVAVGTDTHIEIVDHYDSSSGTLYTFGSHAPGQTTDTISPPISYWSGGAYRYIGPTT